MTSTVELTADSIGAELVRDAGLPRTRRKLRRVDTGLRPYVAQAFVGRHVELTDRHGRSYRGRVVVVSVTTSGAFTHALTLEYEEAGLWPVTLSLATVDEIRQVPSPIAL
jgi:hypothetical protein